MQSFTKLAIILLGIGPSSAVLAQQAAQPATGTTTTAQQPAGAAAPATATPTPAEPKYSPGWVIEVFPSGGESNPGKEGQDGFGAFISNTSIIKMDAHQKTIQVNSRYMYEGKAYFKATKDGRYSFVADLSKPEDNPGYCFLEMSIEGQPIFPANLSGTRQNLNGTPFSLTGGVDLTRGLYEISFQAGCFYLDRSKRSPTITMKVREPGAPMPREMTGQDVIHVSN